MTSVRRIAELCAAASPHKGASALGRTSGLAGDMPISRISRTKLAALGFSVRYKSEQAVAAGGERDCARGLRAIMSMQVVILAGGLATRMLPLTRTVPKILLRWRGDRSSIGSSSGSRSAATATYPMRGVLGEQVEAHVGDGERFGDAGGVGIRRPKLLGTWGALRAAIDRLKRRSF